MYRSLPAVKGRKLRLKAGHAIRKRYVSNESDERFVYIMHSWLIYFSSNITNYIGSASSMRTWIGEWKVPDAHYLRSTELAP